MSTHMTYVFAQKKEDATSKTAAANKGSAGALDPSATTPAHIQDLEKKCAAAKMDVDKLLSENKLFKEKQREAKAIMLKTLDDLSNIKSKCFLNTIHKLHFDRPELDGLYIMDDSSDLNMLAENERKMNEELGTMTALRLQYPNIDIAAVFNLPKSTKANITEASMEEAQAMGRVTEGKTAEEVKALIQYSVQAKSYHLHKEYAELHKPYLEAIKATKLRLAAMKDELNKFNADAIKQARQKHTAIFRELNKAKEAHAATLATNTAAIASNPVSQRIPNEQSITKVVPK